MIDKFIVKFLFKAITLYVLWYTIYVSWLGPEGKIDKFINLLVANCGHWLIKQLGYESCIDGVGICVRSVATVRISNGCNGLELMLIFMAFIILFQGSFFKKLVYIFFGVTVIFISNILRVTLLALDNYQNKKYFDFNHHYTYTFSLYFIIFCLWLVWILLVVKPITKPQVV
jgi:exosortase family protein XrtF